MNQLTLTNGLVLPVESILEIDIFESYGKGFRAKIWRTDGYENTFTEWTLADQAEANRLKIKTTMKTT